MVIFSSLGDVRDEYIQQRLTETFPNYQVIISYLPTGNNAAKLQAEGVKTECDIVLALDTGYLEGLTNMLASLENYDVSMFIDDLVPSHHKYLPWERWSGCVAINKTILKEKNVPVPASYADLLKSQYKGLISMPNPKSSGTGYMLVKSLINVWGEDKALVYFDDLADNILQFTSSGSGPVNALLYGEAGIGLGMTHQTVVVNNDSGADLDIYYFSEGAPFSLSGVAIIAGKETRVEVSEIFRFIVTTLSKEDKERFSPEIIFKDQVITVPNYPQNIPYADMTGISDADEKQRILEKWKY